MATLTSPGLQELLTNVRNMLNQPSSVNSFWSDDELTTYINEAIRRYFTEVVQHANGEFDTTATLNIVANTDAVPLPSDFFKVRAVYRTVTDGYEMLEYRNNLTEGYYTNMGGGAGYLPYYYLRSNSLVLRPVANFSETGGLYLEYTAFPPTMLTGGDTMTADVSPIFRDMVEVYAVYKAKVKESLVSGTDTTAVIKKNLDDLYIAFKDIMSKRTQQPSYVQLYNPEIW